jgi:hypothetical protein
MSERITDIVLFPRQVCLRRESRRRNCLTDTTPTPDFRAILIRSRSRLRSSSLVTKYRAFPTIAASRISSSSGSRQIFSSPLVWTIVARAAMSRANISASSWEYLKRPINLGRPRTSAISISCEEDVTALKPSRAHAFATCPGGPVGFKKADTQTLVSSRATSGTALRFDLSPGLTDLPLDFVLRYRFRSCLHPAPQTVKFTAPLPFWVECDQNARLFLQSKAL